MTTMRLRNFVPTEAVFHRAFQVGIVIKGIDGALEIIGGVLLFLLNPASLNQFVLVLTQHELSEDPRDLVANDLVNAVHHLSASMQLFGSVYLLSHGLIKVLLIASLWQRKLWAYPTAIVFFLVFIGYQVYRYSYGHALGYLLLTLLDLAVVTLTWREYQRIKRRGRTSA